MFRLKQTVFRTVLGITTAITAVSVRQRNQMAIWDIIAPISRRFTATKQHNLESAECILRARTATMSRKHYPHATRPQTTASNHQSAPPVDFVFVINRRNRTIPILNGELHRPHSRSMLINGSNVKRPNCQISPHPHPLTMSTNFIKAISTREPIGLLVAAIFCEVETV